MLVADMKKYVALKLKAHCRKVGWTQAEFAAWVEVTPPRASNLFSMQVDKFSLDMLLKMAHDMDLNVSLVIE